MKPLLLIVLIVLLQSQSCEKNQVKIPACIQGKIDALQLQPKYNPPATVYRYRYMDKWVYLFSSDCCDQYNYLFDKDCNLICAPSGGITGKGDMKCPDFKDRATEETLIWRDDRK